MKIRIKTSILILGFFSLVSCITQIPISSESPENNQTYDVEYLFEHEGCKVYRFSDMGHYVYFTNCKGDVTSIKNDSTQTKVLNMVRDQVVE